MTLNNQDIILIVTDFKATIIKVPQHIRGNILKMNEEIKSLRKEIKDIKKNGKKTTTNVKMSQDRTQ